MSKGKLSCNECGRTFSMPAHLARHMSGSHGVKPAGGPKKTGRKPGRPPMAKAPGRRRGRMPAAVARLNLGSLSADELGQVMVAARDEIQRRIYDLQHVMG